MAEPVVVDRRRPGRMAAAARLAKLGHPVELVRGRGSARAATGRPVERPRRARSTSPGRPRLPGPVARPVSQERSAAGGRAGPDRVCAGARPTRAATGSPTAPNWSCPPTAASSTRRSTGSFGRPSPPAGAICVDGLAWSGRPCGRWGWRTSSPRSAGSAGRPRLDRPTRRAARPARPWPSSPPGRPSRTWRDRPQPRPPARLAAGADSRRWPRSSCGSSGPSVAGRSARDGRRSARRPGAGRSSVLVEALAGRLALARKVAPAAGPWRSTGRVTGVRAGGAIDPPTVVSARRPVDDRRSSPACAADPGWQPALAPAISHAVLDRAAGPGRASSSS